MSFSGTKGYLTKPKPGVMLNPMHPLSKGLVGYWLFNEGSGSKAYDISGHGNHGTLKNMSPNVQGSGWGGSKFGGGLSFGGVDDYVDCGDKATFELSIYSWSMWIKGNSAPGTSVITQPIRNANEQFQFNWDHTNSVFKQSAAHMSGSSWYKSQIASALYADIWYHITATYDGTNIRIYLNGKLENTDIAPAPDTVAGNLNIGKIGATNDSIHIYNRALSADEVKTLYLDPFCNLLQVPIRRYSVAAPPVGAIMNQFQGANIGADLYNGVFA